MKVLNLSKRIFLYSYLKIKILELILYLYLNSKGYPVLDNLFFQIPLTTGHCQPQWKNCTVLGLTWQRAGLKVLQVIGNVEGFLGKNGKLLRRFDFMKNIIFRNASEDLRLTTYHETDDKANTRKGSGIAQVLFIQAIVALYL